MSAMPHETPSNSRKLRLLVTYSISSTAAQATRDYLRAFKEYTDYDVSYLHVTHEAVPSLDLNAYDVILNSYCARHCFDGYVSPAYLEQLKAFRGLKIISVQDDGDLTHVLHRRIRELGFHVLLTAVPEDTLAYGYPPAAIPNVRIVRVYTGYLPSGLVEIAAGRLPLAERPIPLGYRGRRLPARYGRLGHLKYEIGNQFKIACEARGIACDISMQEEDRIYGGDWLRFLGNCQAVLGSESGSNVWDFDGEIDKLQAAMTQDLGRPPSYEEFEPFIRDLELRSNISEVSPRHFEAAATYTPMIMTRGKYSGILEAGKHYIPVEHDFSNIDQVLDQLRDIELLTYIADETHRQLIESEQYTYRSLAKTVSRVIEEWRETGDGRHLSLDRIAPTHSERPKADENVEFPSEWPLHHLLFQYRYNMLNAGLYKVELNRLSKVCTLAASQYVSTAENLAKAVLSLLDSPRGASATHVPATKKAILKLLEDQFGQSQQKNRETIKETEDFVKNLPNQTAEIESVFAHESVNDKIKNQTDAAQKLCTDSVEQIRKINESLKDLNQKFKNLISALTHVERNLEYVNEIQILFGRASGMPPDTGRDVAILEADVTRIVASDLGEGVELDETAEATILRWKPKIGFVLRAKRLTRRLWRLFFKRAAAVVRRIRLHL